MQTRPETPQSKHPHETAKTAPKPFAQNEGDKQVVNGIGDTGDEEKERHTTTEEKNKVSRTRE